MMDPKSDASAVPSHKLSRLVRLGGLAGGLVGGMVAEGARQYSQGNRPTVFDLVLTPGNARRLAQQLAHLRGAAMKVGQLLSMDAGELLPTEFAEILARLRAGATPMPMSQLVTVLEDSWGKGWERNFERFSFSPLAAASIGQVHRGVTKDGRRLAIKIQFPGIRDSIESDVDNVAMLLRVARVIPENVKLDTLYKEAKLQLRREADYIEEATYLKRFHALLKDAADYKLPAVHDDLTHDNILAMEFLDGKPVESLTHSGSDVRDRVARLLLELFFRELLEFRMIQSDPNFANFLYDPLTQRLGLLDFGATRCFSSKLVEAYKDLLRAAVHLDRAAMIESAGRVGYFADSIQPDQRDAVLDIFLAATEPARHAGRYDFEASDLAARIRDAATNLSFERGQWHTPPVDALFLHRKLAGLYLLISRLNARVDVGRILDAHLAD